MKLEIEGDRQLIAWTIARSLYGANKRLCLIRGVQQRIIPVIVDSTNISLTPKKELVFSNDALIKAAKFGFAFPKLSSLLYGPLNGFKAIKLMLEINRFYMQEKPSVDQVMVLISLGLEATVAFLNYQPVAMDLMQDEIGCVQFYLANRYLGSIFKKHGGNWLYTPEKSEVQASVVVTFQDLEMTMNAAFGRVDPLIDPPQGRLLIEGRLPLLEKVAYVSRLVEKNLPFPANSPHAH